jgi:hypothetical protein
MGLDKYSNVGSFEEMAEQQEQTEKTPAEPQTDSVPTDEGVTAQAVEAEIVADAPVSSADNVETVKTE